ncbi:MAG TPA: hypothetical protein VEL07_00650 [Planctomycetota bacterium]|nr:hypothetical protein [Planctomycetota bacterium]
MQHGISNPQAEVGGFLLVLLAFWLVGGLLFAWLGMILARGKGQSSTLGGVLGFVGGIIGLIIIMCLPTRDGGSRRGRRGRRGSSSGGRRGIGRATGRVSNARTTGRGRGTASHGRATGGYRRSA